MGEFTEGIKPRSRLFLSKETRSKSMPEGGNTRNSEQDSGAG
jgi:hypothetical protein